MGRDETIVRVGGKLTDCRSNRTDPWLRVCHKTVCVARAMLTSSFAYQAAEKLSRAGLNLFSRMGFGHTYGNSLN